MRATGRGVLEPGGESLEIRHRVRDPRAAPRPHGFGRDFGDVFGILWQMFNDQEDMLSGRNEKLLRAGLAREVTVG
ncbi:hypothetical protein ACIOHS_02655 [Streptomyces sp. NPDC088253]|uniref:hypothetical protein n=1 Tax=Streptomyces sp. NPDC088253 TaxID=3365846 RepID=UPI003815E4A2